MSAFEPGRAFEATGPPNTYIDRDYAEDNEDERAVEIALLLSKQDENFGTNMIDSFNPETDEPEVRRLAAKGMSRNGALLKIFEAKFGRVAVENTEDKEYKIPRIVCASIDNWDQAVVHRQAEVLGRRFDRRDKTATGATTTTTRISTSTTTASAHDNPKNPSWPSKLDVYSESHEEPIQELGSDTADAVAGSASSAAQSASYSYSYGTAADRGRIAHVEQHHVGAGISSHHTADTSVVAQQIRQTTHIQQSQNGTRSMQQSHQSYHTTLNTNHVQHQQEGQQLGGAYVKSSEETMSSVEGVQSQYPQRYSLRGGRERYLTPAARSELLQRDGSEHTLSSSVFGGGGGGDGVGKQTRESSTNSFGSLSQHAAWGHSERTGFSTSDSVRLNKALPYPLNQQLSIESTSTFNSYVPHPSSAPQYSNMRTELLQRDEREHQPLHLHHHNSSKRAQQQTILQLPSSIQEIPLVEATAGVGAESDLDDARWRRNGRLYGEGVRDEAGNGQGYRAVAGAGLGAVDSPLTADKVAALRLAVADGGTIGTPHTAGHPGNLRNLSTSSLEARNRAGAEVSTPELAAARQHIAQDQTKLLQSYSNPLGQDSEQRQRQLQTEKGGVEDGSGREGHEMAATAESIDSHSPLTHSQPSFSPPAPSAARIGADDRENIATREAGGVKMEVDDDGLQQQQQEGSSGDGDRSSSNPMQSKALSAAQNVLLAAGGSSEDAYDFHSTRDNSSANASGVQEVKGRDAGAGAGAAENVSPGEDSVNNIHPLQAGQRRDSKVQSLIHYWSETELNKREEARREKLRTPSPAPAGVGTGTGTGALVSARSITSFGSSLGSRTGPAPQPGSGRGGDEGRSTGSNASNDAASNGTASKASGESAVSHTCSIPAPGATALQLARAASKRGPEGFPLPSQKAASLPSPPPPYTPPVTPATSSEPKSAPVSPPARAMPPRYDSVSSRTPTNMSSGTPQSSRPSVSGTGLETGTGSASVLSGLRSPEGMVMRRTASVQGQGRSRMPQRPPSPASQRRLQQQKEQELQEVEEKQRQEAEAAKAEHERQKKQEQTHRKRPVVPLLFDSKVGLPTLKPLRTQSASQPAPLPSYSEAVKPASPQERTQPHHQQQQQPSHDSYNEEAARSSRINVKSPAKFDGGSPDRNRFSTATATTAVTTTTMGSYRYSTTTSSSDLATIDQHSQQSMSSRPRCPQPPQPPQHQQPPRPTLPPGFQSSGQLPLPHAPKPPQPPPHAVAPRKITPQRPPAPPPVSSSASPSVTSKSSPTDLPPACTHIHPVRLGTAATAAAPPKSASSLSHHQQQQPYHPYHHRQQQGTPGDSTRSSPRSCSVSMSVAGATTGGSNRSSPRSGRGSVRSDQSEWVGERYLVPLYARSLDTLDDTSFAAAPSKDRAARCRGEKGTECRLGVGEYAAHGDYGHRSGIAGSSSPHEDSDWLRRWESAQDKTKPQCAPKTDYYRQQNELLSDMDEAAALKAAAAGSRRSGGRIGSDEDEEVALLTEQALALSAFEAKRAAQESDAELAARLQRSFSEEDVIMSARDESYIEADAQLAAELALSMDDDDLETMSQIEADAQLAAELEQQELSRRPTGAAGAEIGDAAAATATATAAALDPALSGTTGDESSDTYEAIMRARSQRDRLAFERDPRFQSLELDLPPSGPPPTQASESFAVGGKGRGKRAACHWNRARACTI